MAAITICSDFGAQMLKSDKYCQVGLQKSCTGLYLCQEYVGYLCSILCER